MTHKNTLLFGLALLACAALPLTAEARHSHGSHARGSGHGVSHQSHTGFDRGSRASFAIGWNPGGVSVGSFSRGYNGGASVTLTRGGGHGDWDRSRVYRYSYRGDPRFGWDRWRGGHWYHVRHDGRLAWWWVVDGFWFGYPVPIYPYPAPAHGYSYGCVSPYEHPAYPTYSTPPPAPGPAPQQSWYHCDDPTGYYPYVSSCPGGWQAVPITPPQS